MGYWEFAFRNQKGQLLADVRNQINDLDKASSVDLGKGYRSSAGLWGWLLGKNDVIVEDGQCLTGSRLIKAFRASNIVRTYQFKNEITGEP